MIDVDKINYHSAYPIDKIVQEGTVTITNSGATDPNYQRALIVTETTPNTYGKKVFVRAVWSIDGANYNSLSSHVIYTFTITLPGPITATLSGLKAAVSVGVSDSLIYFRTGNGYHGDVTDDGGTITYTPTPLTFIIKYALFEVE